MKDCIFCKIIAGEIPSAKVYEDEEVFAFLDITQVTPGHTLVIPKKHIENLMEYTEDEIAEVSKRLPKIARAILKAFPNAEGINLINNNGEAAYQSVFHSHFHLIPRYDEDDGFSMQFIPSEHEQEEFQARAQKIAEHIE